MIWKNIFNCSTDSEGKSLVSTSSFRWFQNHLTYLQPHAMLKNPAETPPLLIEPQMATPFKLLCFLFALTSSTSLLPSSCAQTCSGYTFSNNKVFSSCTDLPHLGASLYYDRDASANTVSVAFKAPQTSTGWVAWGLNPNATKMVGSQAIVAFLHSNGSMMAYPTQLDSYAPSMAPAALSFPVNDVSAEYVNKEMIIFATLGLVGGGTKFNQVWQEGSTVLNDVPKAHSTRGDNIKSLGTIDFQ